MDKTHAAPALSKCTMRVSVVLAIVLLVNLLHCCAAVIASALCVALLS
jgi:hypothetical protein